MASTCPRCNAATQPDDQFCPTCGQRLTPVVSTASSDAEYTPLNAPMPQRKSTRRPKTRRPWYRRWRLVVPLVLVGMILLTLGAGAWYIKTRFDTLNELSTPPPQISGDRLGGDEEMTIDTGPAQDAVREAQARREAARNNPPPTLAPTDAPAAAGETEATGNDPETGPGAAGASGDGDGGGPSGATTADESGTGDIGRGGNIPGGAALPQGTAVIEVNPQGTPVLVSEPAGTPTLAQAPEPVEKDSYAFLMMGVDARPGEAIDVGVRPDSLFVVYLDGSNGSCRVLSVPRDTRTTLPGYGQSKINHALAVGGVPYERLVVENLLGIELEHYGLIDFAGVEQLVDSVGGVTVNNDFAFSAGGHDFPVGTIDLDGEEALAYSRFRGGPDGDFGRQERQQAVVRALLTKGADMDAVTAVPQLLSSVNDHIRTDLGPNDMVDIAQDFRATCNGDTLETERIEGDVAWAYDDVMKMELSFVLVDPAEVQDKAHWLLTGSDDQGPTTPAPPPASPAASPAAFAEPTRPRSTPTDPAS